MFSEITPQRPETASVSRDEVRPQRATACTRWLKITENRFSDKKMPSKVGTTETKKKIVHEKNCKLFPVYFLKPNAIKFN